MTFSANYAMEKLTYRKLTKIYCTFKKKLLRKLANKIGPQGICLVVTIASFKSNCHKPCSSVIKNKKDIKQVHCETQ